MTQPAVKAPAAPKMNVMSLVRRGPQKVPLRLFIHGVPKVGKSTCASGAPDPLFLPLDNGVEALDVAKLPKPKDWDNALDMVRAVADDPGEFKTLVIDPINLLEAMCFAKVTGGSNIDKWDGGYGRGFSAALDHWRVLLSEIERAWTKGMNIILVAHSDTKNAPNPEGADYLHFVPAMKPNAAGLFTGWVDAILFARTESGSVVDSTKKAKGVSTKTRVFHTTWAAPWEAGNRWSLPDTIPLGWVELQDAIAASERSADDLRSQITAIASQLGPDAQAKAKSYVNSAGSRVDRLREILNALNEKVKEVST